MAGGGIDCGGISIIANIEDYILQEMDSKIRGEIWLAKQQFQM